MKNIFLESFRPQNIIDNPSIQELKELSMQQWGIITEFGNFSVVTPVRNRIAKFTGVILNDPALNSLVISKDCTRK
ncbi:MAG: hypothetical protein JXA46_10325 [Dehalococcoidales bacterium]|nr:hypothetical protein [Dehalococcoidales bacterium]